MDPYAIAFSVLLGPMAVVFANVRSFASPEVRRERYVRGGVLAPGDAPAVDAPAAFIAREAARERTALVGSAVLTALAVVGLAVAGAPTAQAVAFVVLCTAFLGRALVIAVLAAREALHARTTGPRVSRGAVRALGDQVAVWPFVLATAAHALFLGLYVPASWSLRPELAGWVLAVAAVSAAASVGGWVLAAWVARQPQLAADAAELAWSDAARRRDLTAILLVGPLLAVGVTVSAFTYTGSGSTGDPVGHLPALAFGYLGCAVVLLIVAAVQERRARRTHPEVSDARR